MKQLNKKIIVKNFTAGYTEKKSYREVINSISFEIGSGELVCLMGPNGAGKSTLLRCISGLQDYESGEVIISSRDLKTQKSLDLAKKLAVVLTEPVATTNLKVKELVAMGRYPYLSWILKFSRKDEYIINETAEKCGVSHLLDKEINSLSDGQRQKVFIARALVQESDILILDEPTSHLDLNNRVEIINLLKTITRENNKAIIMATHELDLALQMADRLLLLNNKGELFQGIPEDLVLNGKLDEVFSFKGYDLKTGKVLHSASGNTVNLQGEGYIYLWTKNALEREGYTIDDSSNEKVIINNVNEIAWLYNNQKFSTIESLIISLKK